eukprot:13988950-Alexandrium_andersonii.AAC.1
MALAFADSEQRRGPSGELAPSTRRVTYDFPLLGSPSEMEARTPQERACGPKRAERANLPLPGFGFQG